MTNEHVISQKQIQLISWTLLGIMPIIGMAVDLVSPSLPGIAIGLHISANSAKNVISIYLLGYALGNFFTGFLTDALGRQMLIRIGLLGFVIVSFLPVCLPYIEIILATRLLQGITIGAVAVIARAIFSDILPSEKLVRLGTLIGTMWGIGPVVGPIIGGYLEFYYGWRSCFLFFTIVSLIALIIVFKTIPETHFRRHHLNFALIKNHISEVITNRTFMAIVVLMGLSYSMIVSFNTSGPFLIEDVLHYTPVFFGRLALFMGMVFLLSTIMCRHILKTYKVTSVYFTVLNLSFVLIILALMISYIASESIIFISITSALMFFIAGFVFPMSTGKGLSLFRHIAGTASAMMYLINVLITSLISFLLSFINIKSTISLTWTYLLLILLSVVIYWKWVHISDANNKSSK